MPGIFITAMEERKFFGKRTVMDGKEKRCSMVFLM